MLGVRPDSPSLLQAHLDGSVVVVKAHVAALVPEDHAEGRVVGVCAQRAAVRPRTHTAQAHARAHAPMRVMAMLPVTAGPERRWHTSVYTTGRLLYCTAMAGPESVTPLSSAQAGRKAAARGKPLRRRRAALTVAGVRLVAFLCKRKVARVRRQVRADVEEILQTGDVVSGRGRTLTLAPRNHRHTRAQARTV